MLCQWLLSLRRSDQQEPVPWLQNSFGPRHQDRLAPQYGHNLRIDDWPTESARLNRLPHPGAFWPKRANR